LGFVDSEWAERPIFRENRPSEERPSRTLELALAALPGTSVDCQRGLLRADRVIASESEKWAARPSLSCLKSRTGKVRYAYSRKSKKGRVISQSRRAGQVLPANTKINLLVSRGRKR
jgi:hypothetical protein